MPSDPSQPPATPRSEYEQRAALQRDRLESATGRARQASNLRLVDFLLILGLLIGAFTTDLSAHLLWLPIACFVWLVIRQARASGERIRARRSLRIYEDGLARLDGKWAGRGATGAEFQPDSHPYAGDLDLFGSGSVFELLCVARTGVGRRRLADWLLAPAAPGTVLERQEAVRDLRPRLDLRETLALVEADAASALDRTHVLEWASAPRKLHGTLLPWLHGALAATSTGLLIGWLWGGMKPGWMALSMLAQFLLAARERRIVEQVLESADRPAQDLALIGRVIDCLASVSFDAPRLRTLHERLAAEGVPPHQRIRSLTRAMDFVDARLNQIFLPVSWLSSLGTQLAYRIEAWRAGNGRFLEAWLDAVAEIEATSSLAGYAYEHPQDPFPLILEEGPLLEGRSLGHPLLDPAVCVRNDIHLSDKEQEAPQAYVISGSNMSGKSTYLRTVGVNVVLALAGAPVCAAGLRLSPLAVGASIQLHDSLQEGASRFYAEIERLREVVDLSESTPPALFLLDEILHGTNSHDRRIGAAAVVRTLLSNGAVGLVTTHDLALAEIESDTSARLTNMHFEDQMEDDRMAFDYTLKPGVVTRSNALALMRAVGLKVENEGPGDR